MSPFKGPLNRELPASKGGRAKTICRGQRLVHENPTWTRVERPGAKGDLWENRNSDQHGGLGPG